MSPLSFIDYLDKEDRFVLTTLAFHFMYNQINVIFNFNIVIDVLGVMLHKCHHLECEEICKIMYLQNNDDDKNIQVKCNKI